MAEKKTLTLEQKQAIIDYLIHDSTKAFFEDLKEFQTDEVEEHIEAYGVAALEFVLDLKEKAKATLKPTVIEVFDQETRHMARIHGTKMWDIGRTRGEAIGELIRTHPEPFNITIRSG